MRTLTDEEKEKLMNELTQSLRDRRTKYDYEKTIQEFADDAGMSYGFAKSFLSKQIKADKMTKRAIILDGKNTVVYSVI
jgi:hypothetical protein